MMESGTLKQVQMLNIHIKNIGYKHISLFCSITNVFLEAQTRFYAYPRSQMQNYDKKRN